MKGLARIVDSRNDVVVFDLKKYNILTTYHLKANVDEFFTSMFIHITNTQQETLPYGMAMGGKAKS